MIFLAGFVAATIGGFGCKIYKNDYRNLYLPAVTAVERSLSAGGTIMAGSEIGFAMGFKRPLFDDRYLGFFSHLRPQVYVTSAYYGEMKGANLHRAWAWSQERLKAHYHLVFENSAYQVYARNRP